jgi:type III secretory pathway component EscV/subtilisin-like proprotein convertase family protein
MSLLSRFRRVKAPLAGGDSRKPTGEGFIGRSAELALFRRLAGIEGLREADEERVRLLVVTGPEGSGKRALLGEFVEECRERQPARCTPVLDLAEPMDFELVLERIATSLEPEPNAFADFHDMLRKYRDRQAGRKSQVLQGAEALQSVTTASREVMPNTVTSIAKAAGDVSQALAVKAEDSPRDLDAVKREFERGLARLARDGSSNPILVFSDFDRSAADPTALWLRTALLPQIASWPLLFVVSAEVEASVESLTSAVPSKAVRLKAFSRAESLEFIERLIGVPQDTRLARELADDASGFPQRLARYREFYAQHSKDPREGLTEEARSWAAGGRAFSPLNRIESRFHRRLILFASPLRWFNAALLEEVAKTAGLVPEEGKEVAASLLETDQRPAWLTTKGGGWGFDEDGRRRDFLDECRRFDPALYAALHLAGARYHRNRLERGQNGSDDADEALFEHRPSTPPSARFDDDDYLNSLIEWLYHLLVVDADRGFRLLVDQAAEATFHGNFTVAERLLAPGPEVRLPDTQLLWLRRLADLARALTDAQYADALKIADELLASGPPTDLLAAQLEYSAGNSSFQLDRPPREFARRFEAANRILTELGTDDPRVVRMRCWNLTWLANSISMRDGSHRKAVKLLGEADDLSAKMDEPGLVAELHRARAIILGAAGVVGSRTRKEYDAAIGCLQRAGLDSDMAYVLGDRAGLLLNEGDMAGARADFLQSLRIYRQLDDLDGQARTLVELVALELAVGDAAAASERHAQAIALRPEDAYLHNRLGNKYFYYNRSAEAIEAYDSALERVQAAVFFANRADARLQLARGIGGPDDPELLEKHYRPALEDYKSALERDPVNLRAGLERAKLERDLGNWAGAAEAARATGATFLEAAAADGDRRSQLLPADRATLTELLEMLDPAEAVALLSTSAAQFSRDRELQFVLGVALRDQAALADPGLREGFLKQSADTLENASRLAASEPPEKQAEYHVALADARAELRDWSGAHEAAAHAASLDEGNAQAREVLRRVRRLRRRDSWEGEIEEVGLFAAAIVVEVAVDLLPDIDPQQNPENAKLFDELLPQMREQLSERTGVLVPPVRFNWNTELPPRTARVLVHRIPRDEFALPGAFLAGADADTCVAAGAGHCTAATRPWDGGPAAWVTADAIDSLQAAQIPVWSVHGAMVASVESVIDKFTLSFVGAQYAAILAADRGWAAEPHNMPRLVRALRAFARRRVPVSALDAVVPEIVASETVDLKALAEQLGGRAAVRPPNPLAYALQPSVSSTVASASSLVVRLADGDVDSDEIVVAARLVSDQLSEALGLPVPEVEVEAAPGLEDGEYEVLVNGVTRFAGSFTFPRALWWRDHRSAGTEGRTGRFQLSREPGETDPGATVGRAVEQVLWDDPSLLLTEAAALRMVEAAGTLSPAGGTAEDWARALRQCSALRVPFGEELHDSLQASSQLSFSEDGVLQGRRVERRERAPERPIPDAFPLGIRDVITVDTDTKVSEVHVRVNVRHRYHADLRIRLLSPDGKAVELPVQPFGYGDDIHLDVEPATLPQLASLAGQKAAGAWTLHVQDLTEKDAGTLLGWTLELVLDEDGESGPAPEFGSLPSSIGHPNRGRAARLERLAQRCRPYEIQIKLGPDLHGALSAGDRDSHLNAQLLPAVERYLFQELGLSFRRAFSCAVAPDLPEWGFQIVINGLPRATGVAPDMYFVPGLESETSASLGLDPETGLLGSWVGPEIAGGQPSFDPGYYVMRQLVACVREAGREFADLAWTEQFLDRVAASFPVGIAALRSRLSSEMIASLLGRLVAAGLSMRDIRILDLLVDLDETAPHPRELDAAATEDSLLQSPATLAEYVFGRLVESAVAQNGGSLTAVELDADTEEMLRESLSVCRQVEQVYDFEHAGGLLRSLRQVVAAWPEPTSPIVLTSADLRRHVARLIAAQFPRVSVLPRDSATGSMPIVVAATIGATPPMMR